LLALGLAACDEDVPTGATERPEIIKQAADPEPEKLKVSMAASERSGNEGDTLALAINLNRAADSGISVYYRMQAAGADLNEDIDTAATGAIQIPSGSTSAALNIAIRADSTTERDESFDVVLTSATYGVEVDSANNTTTITIPANGAPLVTSIAIQNGLTMTADTSVDLNIGANYDIGDITHYLIMVTSDSATPSSPAGDDSRWTSLANPSTSIDVSVDNVALGDVSRDAYVTKYLWLWVKDAANTLSSNTLSTSLTQTSPLLYADGSDQSADPLVKYQWHLRNTGQANFDSDAGVAGIDLNLEPLASHGLKGRGVVVNIVDTGLEIAHPDLSNNIVSGSDDLRDGVGGDLDPSPLEADVSNDGDHGTTMAGIVAMREGNALGGMGIAPRASLIGHNYLMSQNSANLAAAYSSGDIVNLSLGSVPGYIDTPNQAVDETITTGLTSGRSGKGRIYVKAASNGYIKPTDYSSDLANTIGQSSQTVSDDPTNTLPILVVGSVNANGVRASYSSSGAALWISGPGGEYGYSRVLWDSSNDYVFRNALVTTDVQGCDGGSSRVYDYTNDDTPRNVFEYNYTTIGGNRIPLSHSENQGCDYTSTTNGTSAAVATVSGVVALMLEANPDLTHWDVRHILAKTAKKIDADYSVDISSANGYLDYALSPGWITNNAGYHFSDWYGFGLIDANAAVIMAQGYDTATEGIQTSQAQDISYDSGELLTSVPNRNTSGASHVITVAESGTVLAVTIRPALSGPRDANNYIYAGRDIQVELTSPSGTSYVAFGAGNGHNKGGINNDWSGGEKSVFSLSKDKNQRLAINAFYGESIQGDWTIRVKDLFGSQETGGAGPGSTGEGALLHSWALDIVYK